MTKKKYVPPYPLVEIVWDDAASNAETWVELKDLQEPEQVITVGFLVKTTERGYCIANSVSNDDTHEETVGNTLTIPRGMVVSYREIKVTTKKAKKHDPSKSGAPQREDRRGHGARADDDPQRGTSPSKA